MDKGVERIYPNGEGNMDFSNVVRMVKKMNDGTVMVGTRAGSLYHYSADMSGVGQEPFRFECLWYSPDA